MALCHGLNSFNNICFSELTQIVADVIADPTLPRTHEHQCPRSVFNCSHIMYYVHSESLRQSHSNLRLTIRTGQDKNSNIRTRTYFLILPLFSCGYGEAVFFQSQSSKADVRYFFLIFHILCMFRIDT
jgi:hypothetical protein